VSVRDLWVLFLLHTDEWELVSEEVGGPSTVGVDADLRTAIKRETPLNLQQTSLLNTIKVELSLYLTKHHAIKTYWGRGSIATRILDYGTTSRWVVSPHWRGDWEGPNTGVNALAKRKIPSLPLSGTEPLPLQPVAQSLHWLNCHSSLYYFSTA